MENLLKTPIAHRGLHGNGIPENSLSAFQAAVKAGFAIETDVHFTKDGKVVIFHDNSLLRMTGDKRMIATCTFEELSGLRLKETDEGIPLLTDFLQLVSGRTPILLEIKNEPTANTKEFLQAIAEEFDGYKGEYAVQSFQPLYVRGYKKLRPRIPCGILTEANPSPRDFAPPFAVLKRKIVSHMSLNFLVKPDFISFYFQEPTKKMQKFKGAKFAWTIRSEQDELLARRHADNIIFEKYLPNR